MDLIKGINSEVFTLSAIVIGYLLIDDSTPAEQNSLGNWFMMIGQVLCTNSAQQQVLNNNNQSNNANNSVFNDNIEDNETNNFAQNNNNNFYNDTASNNSNPDVQRQIDRINKVIKAMQQEIDNLNQL